MIIWLSASAQQQNNPYTFKHFRLEDGLEGNHISAILQDKQGFIWIAGTALQRYDGQHLVTITGFDRLPGSIFYDDLCLYEDRSGKIWVGGPDNIRVYDPLTAHITTIPLENTLKMQGDLGCHTIKQDHHGIIWATTSAGLLQLDERYHRFRRAPGIPDSIRLQMNSAMAEDAAGRLWVSGNDGLYILSNNRQEIYSRYNNPQAIAALNIPFSARRLFEDSRQHMWIASRGDNIVYAFDPASNHLKQFGLTYQKGAFDKANDITEDVLGNIWVTVDHTGLHRYNTATGRFDLNIIGNNADKLGLHYNYESNCLLSDRDGHLWVGTDRGINIMSLHNLSFSRLDHRSRFPGTDLQLPRSEVTGVFVASNGDAYIGYWGAGFAWLDGQLQLKALYPHGPGNSGIPEARGLVWGFAELPCGKILVGQENGFVSVFDPVHKSFVHQKVPAFNDQPVLTMFPESDTLVWVGLYKDGLVRWNPSTGEARTYPQLLSHTGNSVPVTEIVPQGDSILWIASGSGGILRFNKKTERVEKKVIFRFQGNRIENITALLRYNDSLLLAGTEHGIYFYNPLRNTWAAQQIDDTHFDEWILCMRRADDRHIWFTTPFGFYKLRVSDQQLSAFIQNDDIIDNRRRTRRRIAVLLNSNLLVGASNHVIAFSADQLQVKLPPPDVTITDFRMQEQPVIVDSVVGSNRPLVLKHDQNFISIAFKSLQYHDEKLRYSYQLMGVDHGWIPAENLLVARYTDLPPGTYTFLVKSMNMAGLSSRNITTLKIKILPAFWQTWWFRALCILVALALIYGYFRFRVHLVKKEAKERAAFREELAQLEMKALRAQMNPHFIFNSLNSIQTFMMKNETEQALEYLGRFARLIRNVLDHSQLNNISISRETEMLENYMELEKLRLADQFNYRIEIDPLLNADFTEIPAMVIQPFVENAIWHGLLHKEEKGLLSIEFIREDDKIHCIVEDNGIGREAATAFKLQSHPKHISRGLQITKDRLQLYNSRYNMNASFDMEDLKDITGKACGTRVNLWFPLLED